MRNYILLLFSLVFYAWGGVSYTAVLVASIIFNYFFVRQLAKNNRWKKTWLAISLSFNVALILVFKYLDFFIENLNELSLLITRDFNALPNANIVLPLGISFFTFQQMSLQWDVYRSRDKRQLKFINTALYISFFPQLIAGPIVRYNDIIDQIRNRMETLDLINSGIRRFILGLFKKIVIANSCGSIADSIMDNSMNNIDTPLAWMGVISYAFQIYFDFSGYSDMAIGLGRMFGFRILENFNFPYISRSIREFWRRWHISLSTWFRDYVYIPLGGNRMGPYRTYFNLLIVFLLTGFWHGATWSFVFWGVFHGLFLVIERLGFGKILDRLPPMISWAYMMLVVLVGWVFFRIEDLSDAFNFTIKLFGGGNSNEVFVVHYLDREKLSILILAAISSSTILFRGKNLLSTAMKGRYNAVYRIARDTIMVLMFLYSVMYINSGSYNPFIYFRF